MYNAFVITLTKVLEVSSVNDLCYQNYLVAAWIIWDKAKCGEFQT